MGDEALRGDENVSPRPPAVAAEAMVATSQPLATRAGLRALERGGNAADAALAAAAVLCVAEPMSTGLGGDAFALVWQPAPPASQELQRPTRPELVALDAAGPAPAAADPEEAVALTGPNSVTVPGAVAGWAALAARYGRLGLDACIADAIDAAEQGVVIRRRCAELWARTPTLPPEFSPPRRFGQHFRLPELASTLRAIAEAGPEGFYRGRIAEAIASVTWLAEEDLAAYGARWVKPLRARYRGREVIELPPPTQGVAALEALGLLEGLQPDLRNQVACVRLGLEDAFREIRDGADVGGLLDPDYLQRRRREVAGTIAEPFGSTVYLCVVDGDRMAVSFIQSLYDSFGSGVVAPGTGVVLQNRGACFAVSGRVEPGRRPYHTIIPGLLLDEREDLVGPFGVMGGFLQAQAHVQLISALLDDGLDPQAALERPRFRLDGCRLCLEKGLWSRKSEVEGLGLEVVLDGDTTSFGGGQVIRVEGNMLIGGSDPRKDGYAAGF